MITVLDIWKNLCVNNMKSETLGNVDVINAPAFVVESYTRESLAPPGIPVWFWMNFPEAIHPS